LSREEWEGKAYFWLMEQQLQRPEVGKMLSSESQVIQLGINTGA
jgi:hypothetical protein